MLVEADPFRRRLFEARTCRVRGAFSRRTTSSGERKCASVPNSTSAANGWCANCLQAAARGLASILLSCRMSFLTVRGLRLNGTLVWCTLSKVWRRWRTALFVVQPDTVVRWQRERFRKFWAHISRRKTAGRGRPPVAAEIRRLILDMATANPLWRAPRIHGELKMLGIVVSERTVSRILRSVPRPPSQNWKTFLNNHGSEIMAIDFFTVPTFSFKVLFVFVVLAHRRREVLHFNVTEHPTAEWIAQSEDTMRVRANHWLRTKQNVDGGWGGRTWQPRLRLRKRRSRCRHCQSRRRTIRDSRLDEALHG